MELQTDIAIIGAGLTGLTAGHHLKKAGKNFLILEKKNRIGGVINTAQKNGFVIEEGPNTGVVGNPDVADLFDDLKEFCELEVAGDKAKSRYILKNGTWEPLPNSLMSAIKTPLFTLRDKFRLLGEPFRKKGTNPEETLSDLVVRRLGKSFLDYAIDPFILGVYAGDPALIIPKYALPKLYLLEQNYGSFIGGSVKKMFEKKDANSKKATRKVFSAKGGLSNLTKALEKSIGTEKILLNLAEMQITKENGSYIITNGSGENQVKIKAKKVIFTGGAYELPHLFPFLQSEKLNDINQLRYAKVIEVAIGFNHWKGMEINGFGGLIPSKEKRQILGVLFMSSLFEGRSPEGGALLTVFMGGLRNEALFELSDVEIRKIVETELKDLMKLEDFKPDLYEYQRYEKAIPQYGKESGLRFEIMDQIQNENPGLFLGGNSRNGIGMADRIKQGKDLAESACN